MRTINQLAKNSKTFEQFIKKLQTFPSWYVKTQEQLRWGKAQWYEFYKSIHGDK